MGRFPNIAAAKAKTGAAKGKLYGMYAKEIYQVAKNGGTTPEGNPALKRLIEKAKKEQVPGDVIKRAIDKVNSGADESYTYCRYEGFGPGSSNIIVDCLTDNVNRTVGNVRSYFTKCDGKLGTQNSVSHFYESLSIFAIKDFTEEEVLDALVLNDIDVKDIETDEDMVVITGDSKDYNNIRKALLTLKEGLEFEIDEISMVPLEKVNLSEEDMITFNKLIEKLEDDEDVQNIYHNVIL